MYCSTAYLIYCCSLALILLNMALHIYMGPVLENSMLSADNGGMSVMASMMRQ